MDTIHLSVALPARASYIIHALACGHIPGVLSGAELSGKARRFGAKYARSRVRAYHIASQAGVKPALLLIDVGTKDKPIRRRCAVWSLDGKPVRLILS
jgi:hypothetical protein